MKRSYLIIAGIAAVLLIGIIVLLMGGGHIPGIRGEEGGPGESGPFWREGSQGFMTPRELEKMMARGPSPKAEFEMYRTYSQYPDDSRPLSPSMVDLINPWKIDLAPLPVPAPGMATEKEVKELVEKARESGKSEEEIEAEIARTIKNQPAYEFTLNKHTITEGDQMVATLRITKDGDPVRYTITSAEMISDLVFGEKGLGSVPYNDAGMDQDTQANDGVTTFIWKAPSADKKYWGTLTLKVKVNVQGVKDEAVVINSFYSSPVAPAVFSSNFQERLVDGSLVIDATLDVRKECRYSLQANLYSLDEDEPTHWVTINKVLEPGRHVVSFNFFGKIFKDGGYSGKFQLRDVRGTCENMPFPAKWLTDPSKLNQIANTPALNEPPILYIPYNDYRFTTRPYNSDEFSAAEYTSPEKARRLQELEEAARRSE